MRNLLIASILCALVGIVVFAGQTPAPQTPAPSADPYANNAGAGATAFPLAAPAGKDSGARMTPPAGAVNQGPFDPATWKYGTAFNPPPGAKIWNPVKLKMMQGGKVTGGTVFSATDPATYCAMANAGYDFIWTEMQHNDARLGGGRADVAHLPARQGRARRARRLHRRTRDPARARRRRAGDRGADGRYRGRGDRGAQLDLLPAAGPAQQRRRPGVRGRRCGAACRAATATPSTTTSC